MRSERFRGSKRAGAVEIEQFDGKADSVTLILIDVFFELAEIYRSDRISILRHFGKMERNPGRVVTECFVVRNKGHIFADVRRSERRSQRDEVTAICHF